jgi:drug/metabolite transporter (DMT)-like permease
LTVQKTHRQPELTETGATVLLFVAAVIWGVAFVAQRAGMDYVGAFTFNGVRFLLGGLALVPVAAVMDKAKPGRDMSATVKTGLICGLVLFIASSLQQWGIEITLSAGRAGFITGLYIVLTPVLAHFIGKKTTPNTWVGVGLAFVGLYLLAIPSEVGETVSIGDMALLLGAFFWAVHILLIDRYAGNIYPLRFAITQFWVCGLMSLAVAFWREPVTLTAIVSGRVPILYSALLSVGIAYPLQIIGQQHVAPAKAALIFSGESLFAAIGAAVLLHEFLDPRAYFGCALIFGGIMASQISLKKRIHLF